MAAAAASRDRALGRPLRGPLAPGRTLKKGLQAAKVKVLSWGVTKWDLFVLQHYDWHGVATGTS